MVGGRGGLGVRADDADRGDEETEGLVPSWLLSAAMLRSTRRCRRP